MDPKSPEYKKLQAKWYAKLKREGFEDVEQDEEHLKRPASYLFTKTEKGHRYNDREVHFESIANYYQLAGQFFWDYAFETKRDRFIWEMHKDGLTIREIVLALRSKRMPGGRWQVHETIKRLAEIMIRKADEQK